MSDESKPVEDESKSSQQDEVAYSALVDNIYAKLEFFFSDRMTAMFEKADDFLFDSANKAGNIAQQNNLFEFMNALRAQKQGIEKGFLNELNYFLKPIAKSKELPKKKQHKQSDELGLIDQDEMDQMVALTTISGKAAMDLREELSHLDARLEHLGVLNPNIFHDRALNPRIICDALQEALEFSDFSKDNKLILYKIFDQEVIRKLKDLYKELNQLMVDDGILPQIELSKIKRDESHHPEPEDDFEEEEQAPSQGGNRGFSRRGGFAGGAGHQGTGGAAGGMAGGPGGAGGAGGGMAGGPGGAGGAGGGMAGGPGGAGGAGGGMAGGPGGAGGAAGGMAGGPGGAGGAAGGMAGGPGGAGGTGGGMTGGPGGAAGGMAYAGAGSAGDAGQTGGEGQVAGGNSQPGGPAAKAGSTTAGTGDKSAQEASGAAGDQRMSSTGYSVGQIKDSIRSFVGGLPSDSDQAVSGEAGGGGGGYYSHGEVVSALSSLQSRQAEVEIVHGRKLEFNAEAVKKAVLSTIGEKEGGVVSKRVNQVSEKTIDFIKLIFDAIIDEESITDTIKTLLLSLQIPVIKAAMIDADFFVDDKHPARQVLDKIAEAGVGISDHKDPVYIDLEKIVKKLLREFKEDLGAFATALKELIDLTEGIYRKAREKEEISQKEIKQNHARSVVLQEIRKITIGKELPEDIRTLVLKVWPSIMYNHYLNNGKANDEWVEMLMILAKIIESVQPLASIQELEELKLIYQDIVKATRDKLTQLGKSAKVVNKVVSDLQSTYDELMGTEGLPDAEAEAKAQAEQQAEEALAKEAAAAEQEAETEEDLARRIVASVVEGKNEIVEPSEEEPVTEEPIAEQTVEEAVAVEEDSETIARRKIENLPNDIQPGAWFIVYNGEDKPVRRLKLAVILMQDATLVFVDHLGNVVIEKDAEEFAVELEKGLSGIIMQHSVFDHALRSALGSINH